MGFISALYKTDNCKCEPPKSIHTCGLIIYLISGSDNEYSKPGHYKVQTKLSMSSKIILII